MSNTNLFAQRLKELNLPLEKEEKIISLILDVIHDNNLQKELFKIIDTSLDNQ